VDLDADGYTEILNHRKILRKTQKNNNLLITKRILKPKYKPRGARCLHLACQGGRFAPLPTRQLLHCSCTSREGELPKCFQHNFSYRFLRCLFDITKYFDVCDIFLKLVIIPYCLYCLSSLESITVYRSNKKIIPKVSNWNGDACQRFSYNQLIPRADPATAVGGRYFSNTVFGRQALLRVYCCKRDEVLHNTSVTKQWTTEWPYTANAVF